MAKTYTLKDTDEVIINGKLLKDYKKIVVAETLRLKPSQIFYGRVVKSGNGAAITFKKQYLGQQVYIIVPQGGDEK